MSSAKPNHRTELALATDYKSALQELAQSMKLPQPRYAIVEERGPEHAKTFLVEVRVGRDWVSRAEGLSKKSAGQKAAQELCNGGLAELRSCRISVSSLRITSSAGLGSPNRAGCGRDDTPADAAAALAPASLDRAVQILARAFDGIAVVVQQALDFQHQLHVLAAIQTMPFAGFLRPERGEFGLPEAQDVRLDSSQAADLTDAEI